MKVTATVPCKSNHTSFSFFTLCHAKNCNVFFCFFLRFGKLKGKWCISCICNLLLIRLLEDTSCSSFCSTDVWASAAPPDFPAAHQHSHSMMQSGNVFFRFVLHKILLKWIKVYSCNQSLKGVKTSAGHRWLQVHFLALVCIFLMRSA